MKQDKPPITYKLDQLSKKEGTVDVHGLILYTDADPYIKKVLRDDDFWAAYDHSSGKQVSIFSIRPKPTKSFEAMVEIDAEIGTNETLAQNLAIDIEERPVVVIFTKIEEEYHYCAYPIVGNNENETYASVKEILKSIKQTTAGFAEKNLNKNDRLLEEIDTNLKAIYTQRKFDKYLKEGLGIIKTAKFLAGLL